MSISNNKKKSSTYLNQCVIQWCADGREQTNARFYSINQGSQSLTGKMLESSHSNVFMKRDDYEIKKDRKNSINSYKVLLNANKIWRGKSTNLIKPASDTTIDLFLYGHSTFRQYVKSKPGNIGSVRGISVDGHYVSAAKIAKYLDKVCVKLKNKKMRIWLLTCHASDNDCVRLFSEQLAEKLKLLKWTQKQVIGFKETVTPETLHLCRNLAEKTKIISPIKWPDELDDLKPEIITF